LLDPVKLVNSVKDEAPFRRFAAAVRDRGVRTWSTIEEQALLYGIANRHAPGGVIVELGSYCGGSAAFFAKGLSDRGAGSTGRVVCVDPLLGAPPWLTLPPQMFTLNELRSNMEALGLSSLVDLRIGDSAAVGSVWPAEPIDVLLIDGDHSFEGALRDVECWLPKLCDAGILLFDDIDSLEEMRSLDEMMGHMSTLARRGVIEGTAVYVVQSGGGWRLIDELQELLSVRQIYRPWSFAPVHTSPLSGFYRRTQRYADPSLELAYDIGYLAVPEDGDYAVLADSPAELIQLTMSVHSDRGGGDLHIINSPQECGRRYRMVACRPESGGAVAHLLLPCGVVLAWSDVRVPPEEAARLAGAMRSAGLDGVGYSEILPTPVGDGERALFWGVAGIRALSPAVVIRAHMAVRKVTS